MLHLTEANGQVVGCLWLVSGRFVASYAGGYAIWLLYGLSVGNVPLIIVDAVACSAEA
jgi:hypothetical protein